MTVSEWAREFRILSRKDSARPGKWKSEPHQDEMMDAWSDPRVGRVVYKACSQVCGKSQILNNVIGFYCHLDPSNMMVVHPTLSAAEKWAKGRLDPLIEATPVLRAVFAQRKSRDGDSTILHRQFKGGQMFINGANAPADLAAQSVRIVLADEVDRFQASAGAEGDPLELAEQRTETYEEFAKIGHVSTPVLERNSRIDKSYEESDQRIRQSKCPHCDEFFEILWEHIVWDKDAEGKHKPDTAHVLSPCCGVHWSEADRIRSIENGRWHATKPFNGIAGFHINAMSCRRGNLPKLARRWLRAQGNPERIKTFVNLVLALTWKEDGEAPDWHRLYERREEWRADRLPQDVIFLTGSADVQKDRVEWSVWGWARGKRRFLIDRGVILSPPYKPETWDELDKVLHRTWQHEKGSLLSLSRFVIDARYEEQEVYGWVKRHPASIVMAVKGVSQTGPMIGQPRREELSRNGKKLKVGVRYWPINTAPLKSYLYGAFNLDKPLDGQPYPQGYVHLSTRCTDDDLKQLTAEAKTVVTKRGGFTVSEWQKLPGRPNELLDLAVYAHIGAINFGLDRFNDRQWRDMEKALDVDAPEPPERDEDSDDADHQSERQEPERPAKVVTQQPRPQHRRRTFTSSWN